MKNYFASLGLICSIANANIFEHMEIKDISDFQLLNVMFSWQCWASYHTNSQTNIDSKSWICLDKYASSINIEIANALGFCLNDQKFVSKLACNKVKIGKNKMVKFDANPIYYNRKNWNAVVLYNYILLTMYDEECVKLDDKFCDNVNKYTIDKMEKVANTIFEGYKNAFLDADKLRNSIDCSTRDIKEYIKQTNLNGFINSLKTNWKNRDGNNLTQIQQLRYSCFGMHNKFNFDINTNSGFFVVLNAIAEIDGNKTFCNIEVIVKNGKISEYKLYDTSGNTNLFNEIARFRTIKDNLRMDKDFIEQLWQEKLLSLDKVHNLVNVIYQEMDTPYVTYKCYLNSVLQALHASDYVRRTVSNLKQFNEAPRFDELPNISHIVNGYFELIESQKNKQKQAELTQQLADALEQTEAQRIKQKKVYYPTITCLT